MMIWTIKLHGCTVFLELKRAGVGGLHDFFSEINFLVVSYRGDRYLSDAFGPIQRILFLAEVISHQRSAPMSNYIVRAIFNHLS